jgi:hypothetical protein
MNVAACSLEPLSKWAISRPAGLTGSEFDARHLDPLDGRRAGQPPSWEITGA